MYTAADPPPEVALPAHPKQTDNLTYAVDINDNFHMPPEKLGTTAKSGTQPRPTAWPEPPLAPR
jgi:hypothetical protein